MSDIGLFSIQSVSVFDFLRFAEIPREECTSLSRYTYLRTCTVMRSRMFDDRQYIPPRRSRSMLYVREGGANFRMFNQDVLRSAIA